MTLIFNPTDILLLVSENPTVLSLPCPVCEGYGVDGYEVGNLPGLTGTRSGIRCNCQIAIDDDLFGGILTQVSPNDLAEMQRAKAYLKPFGSLYQLYRKIEL